jgi:hypothetical protein
VTYQRILFPHVSKTFASPTLRLLFDHILRDIPKQWSCCTPYVPHCLPDGFVRRQFQLDHCTCNAQNDSQYGGCVGTVKPAGPSLIGIRHFSSNTENPEKHYWRLAAAPWILFTTHCPPQDKWPYETSIMLSFQHMNQSTVFKKDGTNKPRTLHCRPSSYCV